MIEVEKKEVKTTGIASLGWMLGHGFVERKLTVKSNKWIVTRSGVKLCECASQKKAEEIAEALRFWSGEK